MPSSPHVGDLLRLVPPWLPGPERELAITRILTLRARYWTSPIDTARAGEFVFLDCPAWVNVIAITPDRNIVLIEQFRQAFGCVTLELPGGIVDPGEEPAATCTRELAEETGYSGSWRGIIGAVTANPALQNNWCYTGLVEDASLSGAQTLDEREEIAVRLVPLADIPRLLRTGIIHHSLVVAAFHYLSLMHSAG